MCLGEIVYIGVIMEKLQQGIWILLDNSFSISEGKSQSTLLTLSFKLFLRGTWN